MESIKEALSSKLVEATTYLKGMNIHDSDVAFLGMDKRTQILAQHLLNAGVRIQLWEPTTRSPAERQLGGENVVLAKSIADAVKPTQVVFLNLPVQELFEMSEDEVLYLLVCTAMSTDESDEMYKSFTRGNCNFIELAFCGSIAAAEKAELRILVGSSEEQFAKLKPILSVFGSLHYAGIAPKATAVKQSLDVVLAAENAALAVAAAHLDKQGLNTDVFLNVIKELRGCDLDNKLSSFQLRNYDKCSSGFSNDEILLGLTNMLESNEKVGLETSLLASLQKYTELAKKLTGGDSDISSLYDVLNPPITSALPAK